MKFSQHSIKKQFKLILACLVILCTLLATLSYIALEKLIIKNATDYAQSTSQRFNDEMHYLFDRVDTIFANLLFDHNIEDLMLKPYSSSTQTYIKNLMVQFSSYSIMNKDISDIALVTDDLAWSNIFDANKLREFSKQMNGSCNTKSFGITQIKDSKINSLKNIRLVFGRNVYGMHNQEHYAKHLGSIILSIDPSKSSITLPSNTKGFTYFALIDKTFNIYPFNCDKDFWKDILSQCSDFSTSVDRKTRIFESNDYLTYVTPLPDMDYYMVSSIDKKALNKDIINATILITITLLISCCILVILMYIIMHNMVVPLDKLSRYINHIKDNHIINRRIISVEGCSEIKNLCNSFNNLLDEDERLNNELYETTVSLYEVKLEKKQAELDYLRSQINPHFLYNTLESIKDIATEESIPQIATIASSMGKLFRYNVKGNVFVPLQEEIEITKAYLDIQKARFTDKLDVIYSIRENTKEIPIMKFLLQPIVENAVFHGLEPLPQKGLLFIGTKCEDNKLLITIQDDGVGIKKDKLDNLYQQLNKLKITENQSIEHVGILNVHHRILLNYGKPYGVFIESHENEGTKITICIPINKT